MSYFLSVGKYVFFLLLFGNTVFFLSWLWAPKPKFKEGKHYSQKSLEKQQKNLTNHKKRIRNRFILINSPPLFLILLTVIFALSKDNPLKDIWEGLVIIAAFFTMVSYLWYLKIYRYGNSHEKQPDGDYKLYKIDKFFICLFSFGGLIVWFSLLILAFVKYLLVNP